LAVAAITLNYNRETWLDFTHSFHTSGLGIAVGAKQRKSGWSGIIDATFFSYIPSHCRGTGGCHVSECDRRLFV